MIDDLAAFLKADAGLATLLGAGNGNPKIYPAFAEAGETSPYILYSYSTDGTSDDLIDEAIINLSTVAETYDVARVIVEYLTALLDLWDDIVIPSSSNRIYYCKKIGGGSDVYEKDTRRHHMARLFNVKYKRMAGG